MVGERAAKARLWCFAVRCAYWPVCTICRAVRDGHAVHNAAVAGRQSAPAWAPARRSERGQCHLAQMHADAYAGFDVRLAPPTLGQGLETREHGASGRKGLL